MKIAYVTPFFWPVKGGMETHVYEIAKRMSKNHEVIIYTSDKTRSNKSLPLLERINGITIKRCKSIVKVFNFVHFFPSVFKKVLEEKHDIIHIHGYRHPHSFLPFLSFNKYHAKFILTPHFPLYFEISSLRKVCIKIFDFLIGTPLLQNYDLIIALSHSEKLWLLNSFHLPERKIKIVPNGVPSYYLKNFDDGKLFREKYQIGESFLILCIGRLHYSKGFQDLIKSISLLPTSIKSNIKIAIIGEDNGYLSTLQKLTKTLKLQDKVLFLGYISEKEKISAYEAADLVVIPSYWEGFGLVLLESMAKNRTILARKIKIFEELHPEKSFLFSSISELSEKIALIYEGSLKKRKNYNKIVKKHYTWDRVTEKLEKIYQENM